MSRLFYRFRKMESLFGDFNELERQQIFFAEPETLNDPMEGFRDIFWLGDKVVWINFLKNYLLRLERMCSLTKIGGEEYDVCNFDLPVFDGEGDFSTGKYKELFALISKEFLDDELIISLVASLSRRTFAVRRDELSLYLERIHLLALYCIDKIYSEKGLGDFFSASRSDFKKIADTTFKAIIGDDLVCKIENIASADEDGVRKVEVLLKIIKATRNDISLSRKATEEILPVGSSYRRNVSFLIYDFPERYLSQLERLLFPEWYTACFTTKCCNSSVWGHYGDNHTGACLIFEAEEVNQDFCLNLEMKNGFSKSGYTYGFNRNKFYKIDYVEGVGEVDFFRMLGRLPMLKLNTNWYVYDKKISSCSDEMRGSMGHWSQKYWEYFYRDITKKSNDWEYENEYRLILTNDFVDFTAHKDRALNYKFSSLKGIIFGIKASTENKLKTIDVIRKKIQKNQSSDFKFYQAFYDSKKKIIGHIELVQLNRSLRVN